MSKPIRYIRIDDGTDWGCPYTEAEFAAYWAEIERRVQGAFPNAVITIETQPGAFGCKVACRRAGWDPDDPDQVRAERAATEEVGEIMREVWEDGEFWTEATTKEGGAS